MAHKRYDARFDEVIDLETPVKVLVKDSATILEGPVWFEELSELVYSEVGLLPKPPGFIVASNGRRMVLDSDGVSRLRHEPTNMANGHTRDWQGRLLTCETSARRVTRQEPDGNTTVVASHYHGMRLSGPNDIVVARDGSIYFTDTGGLAPGNDLDFSAAFRVSPDLVSINLIARDFVLVNGLAFSPDESILYINDSQGLRADNDAFYSDGTIRAYDVRAGGMLMNGRLFATLAGEASGIPDGMKCDANGRVYCTGPGGIWVFDPDGTHLGTIDLEVQHNKTDATNMAWGGEDWRTLYVTTVSTLVSVQMKCAGVPVPTGR